MTTTVTYPFTANAVAVKYNGKEIHDGGGAGVSSQRDEIAAAIRNEFNKSGTTSGTITITVA